MVPMGMTRNRHARIGWLALAILLAGASVPAWGGSSGEERGEARDEAPAEETGDPADPFHPFNRAMFTFNDWLDANALEPAARGWDFVVPHPAQRGIANFYDNLLFPIRFANDLMQGEVDPAVVILSRFTVNTTVGLAGLFDVASEMGLPAHRANFGQTMGKWGIPPGPYLVLPFFGSSDVRDTAGLIVDGYLGVATFFVDVPILLGSTAINAVNRRSLALEQVETVRGASLDLYSAARDAYFQQREELVKGAEKAQQDRDRDLYFPESEEDEGVFDEEAGP
jgi:phospholipid-binding lipoprotein MlaA